MDLKQQEQDITRLYILKLVPPASCLLYDMHFFWAVFIFPLDFFLGTYQEILSSNKEICFKGLWISLIY